MLPHHAEEIGLELDVPDGWDIERSDELPILLMAPTESGFRANIGVSTGPLVPPSAERLAEVVAQAKQLRAETAEGYEIEDEWRLLHEGAAGWIVRARWKLDEPAITVVQVSALFLTRSGTLYQVNCTALADLASDYLPAFAEVLESLHFTDGQAAD
jgi:hypothetical protein